MTEQVPQIESTSTVEDDVRKCNSCGKFKALHEFGGKATCENCRVKKAAERLKKRKCSETVELQQVELCELRHRVETSESQVDELRLLLIRREPAEESEPQTPPQCCGCISDLEAVRAQLHASQQTVAQLIRENRSMEQKLDILTAQASGGNTQQSQFDFDLVQQSGSHKQARTTIDHPSPTHYEQPLFKYESAAGQATLAGALGQGSAMVGSLHTTPCSGSPEDSEIEMEACLRHFVQPSWKIAEQMGDTFTYLPQQLGGSSSNNSNSFSLFGTGAGTSTSDPHTPPLQEHSSDTMFSEVPFAAEDPASKFLCIEQVPLQLQFDPALEHEFSRRHCVAQANGLGWLGAFSVFLCTLRAVRFWYGTLQYPDSSNVPYIGTAILGLCATQVWWVPQSMLPAMQPTLQRLMYLFSIGVWLLATAGNLILSRNSGRSESSVIFSQGVASVLIPVTCSIMIHTPFWLCSAIWVSIVAAWYEAFDGNLQFWTMSGVTCVSVLLILYHLEYSRRGQFLSEFRAQHFKRVVKQAAAEENFSC